MTDMLSSKMEGMKRPPAFRPRERRLPRRLGRYVRPFTRHTYPAATDRVDLPGKVHRHPLIAARFIPPAHDWKVRL